MIFYDNNYNKQTTLDISKLLSHLKIYKLHLSHFATTICTLLWMNVNAKNRKKASHVYCALGDRLENTLKIIFELSNT
jgi:hypothetical protein